ncbi:F0F1 ATP synthase subunit B [Elusimicrobiota bacterium]
MDNLLNPDPGLVIWTIVSFLVLVTLLRVFAWGPLLAAVDEREKHLDEQRRGAEKAREEAEKIQRDLDERLRSAAEEARGIMAEAGKDGEALRAKLKAEAEGQAKGMLDKTRAQLDEERRRLVRDLRHEVATLSLKAAERLMHKTVDSGVQKVVLEEFFSELDQKGARN